ncbi:MAG: UDP-2,3-diacylglucosamine diphosphatase [Gammaproteobacteria bacterium]|nr:UDP-2,3-diacylglucosamine diphosphatase [Gammaproteobacteria bacterium]
MNVLFVSDLHLSSERMTKLALFGRLLEHAARYCEALYILGDLFEYWVGDDDDTPPHPQVLRMLAAFSAAGRSLYMMHGNRDFLVGERFLAATGCRLLADPLVVPIHGVPTLLMHGDLLCTGDLPYQQLRRTVRSPDWQREALARPLIERRAIAGSMRAGSVAATASKREELMDVEQSTVNEFMRRHAVTRLVHGHTHRPAVHEFELDGQRARRTVLGDWYEDDCVLVCSGADRQLLLGVEDYLAGSA